MKTLKINNSHREGLNEKPSMQYIELLDILAEIIASAHLKTIEKDNGGKSHE